MLATVLGLRVKGLFSMTHFLSLDCNPRALRPKVMVHLEFYKQPPCTLLLSGLKCLEKT